MKPELEPLLITTNELARILSIGRSKIYSLISSNRIGPVPVTFGKSRLWKLDEIKNWVQGGCVSREKYLKEKC